MKRSTVILALPLLLAAQSLWAAHPRPDYEVSFPPMLEQINLSDSQRRQIEQITAQYQERFAQNRHQLAAANARLYQAMQSCIEENVWDAHYRLSLIQRKDLLLHAQMMNEIMPYLSAQQLMQLNEMPPAQDTRSQKRRTRLRDIAN